MSLTPSSLLARLEELKKWQEKQQERLLQHTSRAELSNATSNCDTIEGLSMFDSSMDINKNSSSRADRPILIEKDLNLRTYRNRSSSINDAERQKEYRSNDNTEKCGDENKLAKMKRPFLKRGSGLVRYKMNPGDQKRPFNKIIKRKSNLKSVKSSNSDVIVSGNVDVEITPLKAPDMNVKAVWFKVGSDNGLCEENFDVYNSDSLAKKTVLQINELAAQKYEGAHSHVSTLNEREKTTESKLPVMFENTIQKSLEMQPINDSFIDFEQINHKVIEKEPTEQSLYEKNLERELLIFEALEEKAMNSSFSSTNSSVLHILSSTPSKIKDRGLGKNTIQRNVISEQDEVNNKIEDERYVKENFDILNSLDSSVTSEDFQEKHFKDDEPWSDVNEYVRENSILSSASVSTDKSSEKEDTLVPESEEKPSATEMDVSQEILVKKLKELDDEIRNFRKENTKLQKAKLELEKEQRQFKKEKKAFEKYVLEEKINVEFYLEDEKKKLTKEKMVFERYVKDVQSKTTRKEREEIASLKQELANLKEAAKLKETRNATSQARLRNQIKSFEKDIANLKEDLDKLRKQNAKLTATQKLNKKSSDAKMLQEINKNLSKLTKDVKVSDQFSKLEDSIEKKKSLIDSFEFESNTEGNKVVSHSEENSIRRKGFDEVMLLADTEDDSFFYGKKKNASRSNNRMENQCRNYEHYLKKDTRGHDVIDKSVVSDNKIEIVKDHSSTNRITNTVEKDYEIMFGKNQVNEMQSNGVSETILTDGTKQISYPNGNIKTISPDGNYICLKYFNGDIKETKLLEGTVRYYYAANQSWQISTADGNETIEFANGQVETKFKDGTQEINFPSGIVRIARPDGSQTISYPDKTRVDIDSKGEKIILLPNGQKEIHNSEHMRREYPDGTVKILYPDGIQETRFSNGRIRIKDKDGNLLLDSHENDT